MQYTVWWDKYTDTQKKDKKHTKKSLHTKTRFDQNFMIPLSSIFFWPKKSGRLTHKNTQTAHEKVADWHTKFFSNLINLIISQVFLFLSWIEKSI